MRQDTQAMSIDVATKLESATRQSSTGDFNKALAEVNDYWKNNPGEATDLQNCVAERLNADHILGRVSLFEVKSNFDTIDTDATKSLTGPEIEQFGATSNINPVEKLLLGQALTEMNKITPALDENGNPGNRISEDQIDATLNDAAQRDDKKDGLSHLFEKSSYGGPSLYERLVDQDGNIPPRGISDLLTADHTLSAADKKTLDLLQANRNWFYFSPDLSDAQIKQLCQDNGADFGVNTPPPVEGTATSDGSSPSSTECAPPTTPPADLPPTSADVPATTMQTGDVTSPANGAPNGDATVPVSTTPVADVTPAPTDRTSNGDTTVPAGTATAGDVTPAPSDGTSNGDSTVPVSTATTGDVTSASVNGTPSDSSPGPAATTTSGELPAPDTLSPPADAGAAASAAPGGDMTAAANQTLAADITAPASSTSPGSDATAAPTLAPSSLAPPPDTTAPSPSAAPQSDATQDELPSPGEMSASSQTASDDATPIPFRLPTSQSLRPLDTTDATPTAALAPGADNSTDSQSDLQRQIDSAVTIQRANESYAHCAERLWILAGIDPTGQQIRELAHLMWKSDGSKPAGALTLHEQLQIDETVVNEVKNAAGSKL